MSYSSPRATPLLGEMRPSCSAVLGDGIELLLSFLCGASRSAATAFVKLICLPLKGLASSLKEGTGEALSLLGV